MVMPYPSDIEFTPKPHLVRLSFTERHYPWLWTCVWSGLTVWSIATWILRFYYALTLSLSVSLWSRNERGHLTQSRFCFHSLAHNKLRSRAGGHRIYILNGNPTLGWSNIASVDYASWTSWFVYSLHRLSLFDSNKVPYHFSLRKEICLLLYRSNLI